ncbi:GNAT family N-acetyltransferase [Brevibacillus laterosporus]|uniref:GNAT family N-acetyltransferase n=1 Tax=Brevibacillus laterosporus TaxID=1465 RepID=A0AAP3GC41_BRELA|nr:GNAT family N-acetyltransferase [Brevibacillus laterosporus]MCR8980865.1 GNAT family N-acetyltransferase [Brevibacillus laterosporus]MCZ0808020.1 GNAT family N-acetyltransferase [Brevibacillus laterosporus]MCZ0826418.1 GNAT family N-acetyltransferase [Brevibacillus laterosporus]MCZ0850895.1 GNAT family N-acetyltransferase [Brevibacillus laterosporus]PPA93823.1 GNAT family N-acetyltransferase [Brevibacillus laterosporus]
MKIRGFQVADINQIISLFYDTVHFVNARDYSLEQLNAWAPKNEKAIKLVNWKNSLRNNITYIAEINDKIVGFSDMTYHGHLDRLYTHKDFQGQGIATTLVNMIESEANRLGISEIHTEASITAKPFFERQGYQIIESQIVERSGITLINFKMTKRLVSK